MGWQAAQLAPIIAVCCKAVADGNFSTGNPQAWSNLMWALAKINADKAIVQPVLDELVLVFTGMAHGGKCKTAELAQVSFALDRYGMPGASEHLLAGLPSHQLTAYREAMAAFKAKSG
eukprot:CAMPEP_0119106352 /NCGR_PEP_ID=MMETSP1180-20130426/4068_1 /TAXON_ID=3052 ORGANISM="Chlamydomonas cf sp, Strain CCMP681" /NCGR_SAMPLE_ID=MMETSP1180 /ASSEMBLY_ACC=CAM_ASM_000741 /LENGTH=117 /DNA_ID=CAMNT_0007091669 /DNA_START=178 /DNA_END=531 /DNA_ORIENTATION=-